MSLPRRAGTNPTRTGHAEVERWLRESQARLDPAPPFRRRLRSNVMNTYVASREGIGQPPRRRWLSNRMGALGRACLYASVALAAGAAGVMAASQQALPGEAAYAVKLRIEELRVQVLPSEFQDELALNSLAERVEEMRRLAAAGSRREAAALVPAIARHYAAIEELTRAGAIDRSELAIRLSVVAHLVDALPPNLGARIAALMPALSVASPSVEATGTTDRPDREREAAPALPAPAVEPPTAPDPVPNADPLAPAPEDVDSRVRDEGAQGDESDESDEDDDDDDNNNEDRDSEEDGD